MIGQDEVSGISFAREPRTIGSIISPNPKEDFFIASHPNSQPPTPEQVKPAQLTRLQKDFVIKLISKCEYWGDNSTDLLRILKGFLHSAQDFKISKAQDYDSGTIYVRSAITYDGLTLYHMSADSALQKEGRLAINKYFPSNDGFMRVALTFKVLPDKNLEVYFSQIPLHAPNMAARQGFVENFFNNPDEALQFLEAQVSKQVMFLIPKTDTATILPESGPPIEYNTHDALQLF